MTPSRHDRRQGPSLNWYWISSTARASSLLLATVAALRSLRSVIPQYSWPWGPDMLFGRVTGQLVEEILDILGLQQHVLDVARHVSLVQTTIQRRLLFCPVTGRMAGRRSGSKSWSAAAALP